MNADFCADLEQLNRALLSVRHLCASARSSQNSARNRKRQLMQAAAILRSVPEDVAALLESLEMELPTKARR